MPAERSCQAPISDEHTLDSRYPQKTFGQCCIAVGPYLFRYTRSFPIHAAEMKQDFPNASEAPFGKGPAVSTSTYICVRRTRKGVSDLVPRLQITYVKGEWP